MTSYRHEHVHVVRIMDRMHGHGHTCLPKLCDLACMHTHTHVRTSRNTELRTCTYTYMHIHVHIYIYIYIRTFHTYISRQTDKQTYGASHSFAALYATFMHVRTYVCMYVDIHTYTYIYIYNYICKCKCTHTHVETRQALPMK